VRAAAKSWTPLPPLLSFNASGTFLFAALATPFLDSSSSTFLMTVLVTPLFSLQRSGSPSPPPFSRDRPFFFLNEVKPFPFFFSTTVDAV